MGSKVTQPQNFLLALAQSLFQQRLLSCVEVFPFIGKKIFHEVKRKKSQNLNSFWPNFS